MVKSVDYIGESIFNYLGEDNYATFIALTGLCDGIRLNDGVVWVQYDDNNDITAVIATSKNGKSLVFADDKSDKTELDFIIRENDSTQIDKKYLLRKSVMCDNPQKGINRADYMKIKSLNNDDKDKHNDIVAFKSLLNSMGKCEGAVINDKNEVISGGFITFSQKISLITDIYTDEKHRNKGYGKQIVEKLLNLSKNENVYLVSKEHNLKFYKKCGFEIVKEIYDYKG
ncbi:MAG: GNAT family N-acetyltransferase [Clostridia bacterium]|nr:GNAT family N-acetyltransferase [Clostridia bacterium]